MQLSKNKSSELDSEILPFIVSNNASGGKVKQCSLNMNVLVI